MFFQKHTDLKNFDIYPKFYPWICPGCKMNIHGSKHFCVRCKIRNPYLPEAL